MRGLFDSERKLDIQLAVMRAKVDHDLSRRWMRRTVDERNGPCWTFRFAIPLAETKSEQESDRSFAMRSF